MLSALNSWIFLRRLLAFGSAGLQEIPVEILPTESAQVLKALNMRFDPIGGVGEIVVVVPRIQRAGTLNDLYEYGLIRGLHLEY